MDVSLTKPFGYDASGLSLLSSRTAKNDSSLNIDPTSGEYYGLRILIIASDMLILTLEDILTLR